MYRWDADPGTVDWHRFQTLVAKARSLPEGSGDQRALALYRQAEALWRAEPMAGLGGLWAESVRTTMFERRTDAVIARTAVELRLGHYAEVIAELTPLVAARPTDEVLIGQLMIAHHGRGLHADALRLFADLRRRLREELGSDPGTELAATHRQILSHAPVGALLSPGRRDASRTAGLRLIPQHARLVGREREMRTLMDRLEAASGAGAGAGAGGSGAVAVQSISGMAGVGKSIMAWTAAERLADRFNDGVVHLDLFAHALTRDPRTPKAALVRLLRTVGVPQQSLPDGLDELTELWRTTMSRRRMVLVLDDASGPDQVRPLLPGNSPSLILITSRRRLSGLPGLRPLVLDVLSTRDATALFRRMIDDDRADDPQEIAEIVALCGRLPLAVEIAASRLDSRPGWSLGYLIERLSREHARIEELHDTDREIAGAFYVSYAGLSVEERAVFRLLSLHMMPEFGPYSAAAVTGLPFQRVERVIDALVDAHLLQTPVPERYRYHDLLGEFALGLASAEDAAEDRESAVRRLIDFYIAAVDKADRMIHPERSRRGLPSGAAGRHRLPPWRDAADAGNWLTAEHAGLIRAAQYARTHGQPERAAVLGGVLAGFLQAGGFWEEAEEIHRHAVGHWRETGDRATEARAHVDLGTVYAGSGRYEQAMSALGAAVTVAAEAGDGAARREALLQLGTLHWHQGRFDSALAVQREVLALSEQQGDRRLTARCLNNLGITFLYLGEYETAETVLGRALQEFRTIGDRMFQRRVLNNLADLYVRMENKGAARQFLEEAMKIRLPNPSKSDIVAIDITFASALDTPGQSEESLRLLGRALESSRKLGDLRNQIICLNVMGKISCETGRPEDAVGPHTTALGLARGIGSVVEEVQSLLLLGTAERLLGHYASAVPRLEAALALARGTHLPVEAAEARAELARVPGDTALRTGD